MKRIIVVFMLTFLFMVPQALNAVAEQRVALVIGNGAYESAPLKNPVNDAQDMADALRRLGFEVIHHTNAGKRSFIEAIEQFDEKLRRSEVGLFYFAGHGVQLKGRNFLMPVDARVSSETDVEVEGVDAFRVLGKMEEAKNKLNIVILDACRNNPFARSFRSQTRGLASMNAPIGSIIAYATRAGASCGRRGWAKRHIYQASAARTFRCRGLISWKCS